MFNLHIIQADHGDCFVIEYGKKKPYNYILIDGGPQDNYYKNLGPSLNYFKQKKGKLELIINTHIDSDHIMGINELLANRKKKKDTIDFKDLWFNSFEHSFNVEKGIAERLKKCFLRIKDFGIEGNSKAIYRSAGDAEVLKKLIVGLDVSINPEYDGKPISVNEDLRVIKKEGLELFLIGPTKSRLDALKKYCDEWLDKYEKKLKAKRGKEKEDLEIYIAADASKPNLSSIMFLAQYEGKKILFTGDGLGDDIIKGLEEIGLKAKGEIFEVDYLKIPHHGSKRNVVNGFLNKVIAEYYVISGNDTDDNPDFLTLKWIAEAPLKQGVDIKKIFVTNETKNTIRLKEEIDEIDFKYKLEIMPKNKNSWEIKI